MQYLTNSSVHKIACVVIVAFGLLGCGKVNVTTKFSGLTYSIDTTTNGHRTITKRRDGITRSLETAMPIDLQGGQIKKFEQGAVLKIQESGDSGERQAELRENAGALELWINDGGTFRKGAAQDDEWLKSFLDGISS